MKTQQQIFYEEQRKIAAGNDLFLQFVRDGLTRAELTHLIQHRPALWGRFSNWLEKLP